MSYVSDYIRAIRYLGIYSEEQWRRFVSFFELPRESDFDSPLNAQTQGLLARITLGRNTLINAYRPVASATFLSKILPDPVSLPVRARERLGIVSGCFDLLHLGHLEALQEARNRMSTEGAGALAALVLGDFAITQKKGNARPVLSLQERLTLLASIRLLDWVLPLQGPNCMQALEAIRPTLLFKHVRDQNQEIVRREAECVIRLGGAVVWLTNLDSGFSTSTIIERSRSSKTDSLQGELNAC